MVCGVAVVKNLSRNVRDTGFIPGMGEVPHAMGGNKATCATITEPAS